MSLSLDQKMSLSFFHVIKMKRWNAWGSFCFFSNRNNQRANIDVDSGYCLLTVWSLCMWYKVANLIAWKLMGEWLVIGLAIGHSVRRHKEHHTCCFFLFEFNIFFPKLKWVNVNDIHQWKFSVRDGYCARTQATPFSFFTVSYPDICWLGFYTGLIRNLLSWILLKKNSTKIAGNTGWI